MRWWWPGNDLTDEELRREIGALDKAGFGGAEIQAFFKGMPAKPASDPQMQRISGFATESFFRHVGVAVEEARDRGMFIDYTFGSGWPFGGGEAITPELASIELRSTHVSVEGPAKFQQQLQIPSIADWDPSHGGDHLKSLPEGWAERMKKRTKVVAVVAVRGTDAKWDYFEPSPRGRSVVNPGQLQSGSSVDLTAQLGPDGTLTWDVSPGTWQLFVFCSLPTGQRVNAGAGAGPQLVMDHLSTEAFRAHAKRVGDNAVPYLGKYFGNGLRAIFCDSLEVGANLFWSDDFLAEFRRRRGYDLQPYLPVLKVQNYAEPFGKFIEIPIFEMKETGDLVRHDYRQTVSDLMIERFYEQFDRWARDHKLLSRTQAHGSQTDVFRVYGEADIPETEDLFAKGAYDFLKMAASAAHVYGRSLVTSESFVWPLGAYETTPEKMKLAADELLTAGINGIIYHGFPYIIPGTPPPGWHPFSGYFGEGNYSSQFNELNPLWPYFAQLNTYITRLQYLSQAGRNIAAVALYWDDLPHGADEMPPVPKLNQALMDAGYNYDHINTDSLLHCTVRERMLVTTGGAQYRALVLPPLDAMNAELAGKLRDLADAGLPILFAGRVPSRADGLLDSPRNTQRVQSAMRQICAIANVHLTNDTPYAISTLAKLADPNVKFNGAPLYFIQKRIEKTNFFFLRNSTDAAQHLDAEFEAEGTPELWDPWTGQAAAIASHRCKGARVQVELDLEPMASALIVFNPEGATPVAVAPPAPRTFKRMETVGAAGWKLTATGMLASDKTVTIHREMPALVDWSLDQELRGFSGRGVYTTTFSVPAAQPGSRYILDLGIVREVAEVTVNGKHVANLLLRPYRADITDFIHPGDNQLEIAVTNTLFNYMTLRDPRSFRPGPTENLSGLMSGGLIGPVQLKTMG